MSLITCRWATWDSDSRNTFSLSPALAGRMASSAFMAAGVMATTAPWASTSVLDRMTVMRPLPSFRLGTFPREVAGFGTPQSSVGAQSHCNWTPLRRAQPGHGLRQFLVTAVHFPPALIAELLRRVALWVSSSG